MSKRKCPYQDYEWVWGNDGEEYKEKICPIETKLNGYLTFCYYCSDYKECLTYKYQDRIDKVIEYINTHYLNANEPELLNILNGGDNNE